MNKIIKLKNQKGATLILLVVLILSSVILVSLVSGDLVQNGLEMSRTQAHSTKALFAAEAGVEKVLNDIWKTNKELDEANNCLSCNNSGGGDNYICFNDSTNCDIDLSGVVPYSNACSDTCIVNTCDLSNDTSFKIKYNCVSSGGSPIYSTSTYQSLGIYKEVNRVVEIEYSN